MKTKHSYLKKVAIALAISGLVLGAQAIPTPIDGTISFSGSSTIDGNSFITATEFLSFNEVTVGSSATLNGDYVGTSGAAVTMTPFTWAPTTASTPINPLWSFTMAGITYSFTLDDLDQDFVAARSLLLSGFGTAYITGPGVDKLATSGIWNFSAQTMGLATFTFSSTTQAPLSVPDGGTTLAMLGSALFGFGVLKRK